MSRMLFISTDCHAGLLPGQYREYLDPQFREAYDADVAVQREIAKENRKVMLVEEINAKWRQGIEQELTGAWDHAQRIKVLDGDGIAAEVIFPDGITEENAPPFGAGLSVGPLGGEYETQWAGARAHNRWIAELSQMAPARHLGVAVVPATWDVDEAVREVRWARQNGLGSIMIPVMWGPHAPYHHPKYDPLWAICQELDVVIHFHSGPGAAEEYFGPMPRQPGHQDMVGGMGIYVCEAVWAVVRPLTFLIWGGVFERYPTLKVVVTEATTTWVANYLEHLDDRYVDWHVTAKLGDYKSHLSMKPSDYFHRNIRLGTFFRRKEVERRHEVGHECMMWGSDYPHPEGTWPYTRDMMVDTFRGVPEAEIATMLGGSAAAFYNLDTDRLAPLVAQIGPDTSLFNS
ncbi:MAG: amidohydrolase [Deltaproteobacteria bacterium]|nr:amidohydrolase [Deltaproteobacteria bacterium]